MRGVWRVWRVWRVLTLVLVCGTYARAWESAVAPFIRATLREQPAMVAPELVHYEQPVSERKKAVIFSCGSFCPIHKQHVRVSGIGRVCVQSRPSCCMAADTAILATCVRICRYT
jgi:hypothetical protein